MGRKKQHQPEASGNVLTPDEKHCLKCFYHCKIADHVCCEFILVTGKRRGCDFGRSCTRYLKGDPKIRWGMALDYELEPGVIPGAGDLVPKRTRARRRVPLDPATYKLLRKDHTAADLAELTGTSIGTWNDMGRIGLINPALAKTVYEKYGIDLIKK